MTSSRIGLTSESCSKTYNQSLSRRTALTMQNGAPVFRAIAADQDRPRLGGRSVTPLRSIQESWVAQRRRAGTEGGISLGRLGTCRTMDAAPGAASMGLDRLK